MILCGIKVILTNAHIFLTYMFIRTFPFLVSDQLNNSCFWYECDPARKMKILRRHLMLMLLLPVKILTMTKFATLWSKVVSLFSPRRKPSLSSNTPTNSMKKLSLDFVTTYGSVRFFKNWLSVKSYFVFVNYRFDN